MISLILSLIVLLAGYLVYGRVVEKVFCPDDRQTPALAVHDGVDCVPLKTGRAFLIQLLNISSGKYDVNLMRTGQGSPILNSIRSYKKKVRSAIQLLRIALFESVARLNNTAESSLPVILVLTSNS